MEYTTFSHGRKSLKRVGILCVLWSHWSELPGTFWGSFSVSLEVDFISQRFGFLLRITCSPSELPVGGCVLFCASTTSYPRESSELNISPQSFGIDHDFQVSRITQKSVGSDSSSAGSTSYSESLILGHKCVDTRRFMSRSSSWSEGDSCLFLRACVRACVTFYKVAWCGCIRFCGGGRVPVRGFLCLFWRETHT